MYEKGDISNTDSVSKSQAKDLFCPHKQKSNPTDLISLLLNKSVQPWLERIAFYVLGKVIYIPNRKCY